MNNPSDIEYYYARKASSYDGKYQCGYYTHIHTGIFPLDQFPALHNKQDLQILGAEKIKSYLHWGQEILINHLFSKCLKIVSSPKMILDCGSGHGGTLLYLADNYDYPSVGVTISEKQGEIIRDRIKLSQNKHHIHVKVGNIFEISLSDKIYSIALGIDAFSQMGNYLALLRKVYSALEPNGILAISDCFCKSKKTSFAKYYNKYWASDITSLDQALSDAWSAGFIVNSVIDLTNIQLPSWCLSLAYSRLQLKEKSLQRDARGILEKTVDFHRFMQKSYNEGDAQYYQIILKKK